MGVFDLFSKRKSMQHGNSPTLQSSDLPIKFRRQVVNLLLNTIGKWMVVDRFSSMSALPQPSNAAWQTIFDVVRQEHGEFNLSEREGYPAGQCIDYLLSAETDKALDLMECALVYIDREIRGGDVAWYGHLVGVTPDPDAAIAEFNARCRENGVGYSFENSRIIPVSSSYIATEVVEPALALLHHEGFRGAQDEFMRAHLSLRRGDTKGAIVEATKSFESAMKTVCSRKGWGVDPGAPAKALVAVLFKNAFFPPYLEAQLTHLRCLLETGASVVRNRDGAHGQGPEPVEVPRELAEYAIHLTAANIVLLAKRLGQ